MPASALRTPIVFSVISPHTPTHRQIAVCEYGHTGRLLEAYPEDEKWRVEKVHAQVLRIPMLPHLVPILQPLELPFAIYSPTPRQEDFYFKFDLEQYFIASDTRPPLFSIEVAMIYLNNGLRYATEMSNISHERSKNPQIDDVRPTRAYWIRSRGFLVNARQPHDYGLSSYFQVGDDTYQIDALNGEGGIEASLQENLLIPALEATERITTMLRAKGINPNQNIYVRTLRRSWLGRQKDARVFMHPIHLDRWLLCHPHFFDYAWVEDAWQTGKIPDAAEPRWSRIIRACKLTTLEEMLVLLSIQGQVYRAEYAAYPHWVIKLASLLPHWGIDAYAVGRRLNYPLTISYLPHKQARKDRVSRWRRWYDVHKYPFDLVTPPSFGGTIQESITEPRTSKSLEGGTE